jgi:hypothetical protein
MNTKTTMLLAAAVAGISMGAVACASNPPAQDATSAVAQSKHACKGQNACKGQGGCKTEQHACKGQNACKGQGGCHG